jgi:hypothetical protein
MRVEREHRRRAANLVCLLSQAFDQPRMPAVNPIKVSDRDGSAGQGRRKVIKRTNGMLPLNPQPRRAVTGRPLVPKHLVAFSCHRH